MIASIGLLPSAESELLSDIFQRNRKQSSVTVVQCFQMISMVDGYNDNTQYWTHLRGWGTSPPDLVWLLATLQCLFARDVHDPHHDCVPWHRKREVAYLKWAILCLDATEAFSYLAAIASNPETHRKKSMVYAVIHLHHVLTSSSGFHKVTWV